MVRISFDCTLDRIKNAKQLLELSKICYNYLQAAKVTLGAGCDLKFDFDNYISIKRCLGGLY